MKKQIKAIDTRGRKLGGETPLLCTPLVGRTRERLLAEAAGVLGKSPTSSNGASISSTRSATPAR